MEGNKEIDNEQKEQEVTMAKQANDVVQIELPAPSGWKKKYTPKKGGTPRRNAIVFISPTGEEIKSKRQLDQYLKAHPGGPSASEFDWGTGDTPRRSSRLSEKSKVAESPESETPKKKQRTSSSKKGAKDKSDKEGEGDTFEGEKATKEESEGSPEVDMADGEHASERNDGEIVTKEVQPDKINVDDAQKRSDNEEMATDKQPANEDNVDLKQKTEENNDEVNVEKKTGETNDEPNVEKIGETNEEVNAEEKTGENEDKLNGVEKTGEKNDEPNSKKDDNQEAENHPSGTKDEEDADSKQLLSRGKESNDTGSEPLKPESASSQPEADVAKDASPKADDGKARDSGAAKTGLAENPPKESVEDMAEVVKLENDNLKNSKEANQPPEVHTAPTTDQKDSS